MTRRDVAALSALAFSAALALGAASARGDGGDDGGPSPAERGIGGAALLSVATKHAAVSDIGLWLRHADGRCERVWTGEPYDATLLPDGGVLVAERWRDRVLRVDRKGRVLDTWGGIEKPVDVERARDGTFVVVSNAGAVIGLDERGAETWRRSGFISPFDVACLPDGGLVVADSGAGRVVTLDASGAVVREVVTGGFPNTVEPQPDGGMLVTLWQPGVVIDIAADGTERWRVAVGGSVYRAMRRDDGTTLVTDGERGRLVLLDARGREVGLETFAPGCVDWEPLSER